MKKLISSALAVTILVTPLVSSACFADEINKQNVQYVRNENRSEKFKLKKDEYPKIKKILAGVAAGTIALTSVTVVALKNKLPENLKSKLSFLFTKETQGDNEKSLEAFKEGEDDETFIEKSNITKDETVEPAGVENGNGFIHDEIIGPLTPNYTKPTIKNITIESIKKGEDVENFIEKSNITKDKTVEPAGVENGNGFIHDEIIRPLTPNNIKPARVDNIINNTIDTKPAIAGNITNNTTDTKNSTATNNTNWVSNLKNTAKELGMLAIDAIGIVFLTMISKRMKNNFAGAATGAAVGAATGAASLAVHGITEGTTRAAIGAATGAITGTVGGAIAQAAVGPVLGPAVGAAVGAGTVVAGVMGAVVGGTVVGPAEVAPIAAVGTVGGLIFGGAVAVAGAFF